MWRRSYRLALRLAVPLVAIPFGLALDPARAQSHHTVATRGERVIVRHQHQRGAALLVASEQELDDLAAGRLVEIAGRLVGDEDGRVGRQRAGERHPLLLAAGELRRIVLAAFAQADRGELS